MSDLLAELLAADAPVEREVIYQDKTWKIHFRRITAGERYQWIAGKKYRIADGEKTTIEIDSGDNDQRKAMLVHFCACKPDGSRLFKTIAEAQKLGAKLLDALHAHASEINAEEPDAGKA